MSDRDQHDEPLVDDIAAEERSDSNSNADFQDATDFVDAEIDSVDDINDLSVEALVVLSVLRIVNHPEELRVNIIRASRMVIIELDVKEEDLRYVIGKEGHTVDAVRSVARAASGDSAVEYDIVLLQKGKRPVSGRRRRSYANRDTSQSGRHYRRRSY
jgi:predicted RNA-binding protein YlqC (UPF0109 family)